MMRCFKMLVVVVAFMTAMLVASAAPALAYPSFVVRCLSGDPECCYCYGTPLSTVACDECADASPFIGWHNGMCWVFQPSATSLL